MRGFSDLNLWDMAVRHFRNVLEKVGLSESKLLDAKFSQDLNSNDRAKLISQMQACLEGRGGEVSARVRAAALGHAYLALNSIGRKRFLGVLAKEFGPDIQVVDQAIEEFQNAKTFSSKMFAELSLRKSIESPRVRLLTQFNGLPEGVKFLVDMRAELLRWIDQDATLRFLDNDFRTLLTSWFDVGFLELRQITWGAPAQLLEKLFDYEAVHAIRSWDDLKNRLASDRRCFAFFHPRMPQEPLIFVWVALVEGISTNIQELLDEDVPTKSLEKVDTAIFYSISNAQKGLSGINFGNFLIKRVVDCLNSELDSLKTFATLSPMPGFIDWLYKGLEGKHLKFLNSEQATGISKLTHTESAVDSIIELLKTKDWINDNDAKELLEPILTRLAASYLIKQKRPEGTALDSVAHFHLNNGARIEKINWVGDSSEKGISQSAGIMLNYLYIFDEIEANHESYRSGGQIIASSAVMDLLND